MCQALASVFEKSNIRAWPKRTRFTYNPRVETNHSPDTVGTPRRRLVCEIRGRNGWLIRQSTFV